MSSAPLIEIRNATIFRGNTRVFTSLNLVIPQHEQVAILGPNGSGKTTLLKVINREIYPVADEASTIRILGRSTWNVWDLRSHIGVVSHDLQTRYRPRASGMEVVLSGFFSSIGIHGLLANQVSDEHRQRARSVLRELGAAELADKPLKQMSTGQQRRCVLARALVHRPDTLILDEPTAGMDLSASFDYLSRLRRLAATGTNIILVTHSLNEIPPQVERVILLKNGTIFADGSKESVLTERNLCATYDTEIKVAKIDGYYLAYPPDQEQED